MSPRPALLICPALLLFGGLAVPAASSADEIYRWVDEHGEVHFGDVPPSDSARPEEWTAPERDPVHVVPNDAPPSTAPSALAPRAPYAVPAAPAPAPPERIGGRSEFEWKSEALACEHRIESLEKRIEFERNRRLTGFSSSMASARFDARKKARVEQLEREIEAAEQQLDDLEESAREAGVPPGWLRD